MLINNWLKVSNNLILRSFLKQLPHVYERTQKKRGLRCLLFNWRFCKTQHDNNRTTARACTIWYDSLFKTQESLTNTHQAQAFTVHYSVVFKNFADFQLGIISVKCLQYVISDSQTRNAIRCGITAKVRSKNEYARENR